MKGMQSVLEAGSVFFLKYRLGAGLVSVLLLFFGVSSLNAEYKSLKVSPQPARSYLFNQSQGNVTIAVDPYLENEKIRSAFDVKDMSKKGVFPFHIIVTNDTDDLISVDGPSIQLNSPDRVDRDSLSPEDVVQILLSSKTGRGTSYPSPIPIPRKKGNDSFELHADLVRKELRTLRVEPHTTGAGFLYFQLPPGTFQLPGWRIYVPKVRNLKTRQDFLFFEIDLK